jgi:lactoylglutathione lyase
MKMLHVTIQTNKFESELAFYEKEVGLTIRQDMRPNMDLVFLSNEDGETCVEIINAPDAEDAGNPNLSIGFKSDNVEEKRDQLLAAGYEVTPIICPLPDVKFFFTTDPAGVKVQFM